MTPNQLLTKIIDLLPSLVTALQGVGKWAGAVHGFTRILGQTQLVQAAAHSGVGKAVSSSAGAIASAGGAIMSGIGALASNPVGEVILAIIGVTAAFVGLIVATDKLGRSFLESQRHLAESSASMALVFAQSDLKKTLREWKAGDEQAGTAGFLARGMDKLSDTMQPIMTLLANIGNIIGGALVRLLELILRPIAKIADYLNKIIEYLFGKDKSEGDPIILSQWLDQVAEDAEKDRRRNDPLMRRPAFG